MKFLSAPWRWDFISNIGRRKGCIFCDAAASDDDASLICHRGRNFFVLLNRYPYSTGHLMIVPYRHLATPEDMPDDMAGEMVALMGRALKILRAHFHPDGFNVGMNIGRSAGAGIKDHYHLHVVPRWSGDANFMAVVGDTKVMSYELDDVLAVLRREFRA